MTKYLSEKKVNSLCQMGEQAMARGDYSFAHHCFSDALKIDPKNKVAQEGKKNSLTKWGDAASEIGDHNGAHHYYSMAMETSMVNNLSPQELLARELEQWQKEYYDDVDSHFAEEDKTSGIISYKAWEQRFREFLISKIPSLVSLYDDTVKNKHLSFILSSTIHQNWKRGKGDAIEAFLTQVIKDTRKGHIEIIQQIVKSQKLSTEKVKPLSSRKIFIGHGNSIIWRDLKDFIQDRLKLEWDEFNREPSAGFTTVSRLQEMLEQSVFAFIVLTAEDEHPDGTIHARENVIHESGLFQGRLGFHRAILLVEEGCTEFSNIFGLTQIRFPKGNILAKSEEIRRVLEREGIIKKE
jgi:predicted nucleotide-binding protein